MGMFGNLLGAAINVVSSPIDVVKDVATLGGAITDRKEPYTVSKLNKVVKNIEDAADDAADGDF